MSNLREEAQQAMKWIRWGSPEFAHRILFEALAQPDNHPSFENMLGNLLASIHRDGGHYIDEHGWEKAFLDADAKVVQWLVRDDDKARPTELEMHRADYQACKAAGFESPGELLDAYNKLVKRLDNAQPVAWMDDFGNVFPLAANKGAGSWMDEHRRDWKPLYAASQPQAQKVCKCSLRTRLVGDGCAVCNPELAKELAEQGAELSDYPPLPDGYTMMMTPDPNGTPATWYDVHDMRAYVDADRAARGGAA